jgi:hypothetical protein
MRNTYLASAVSSAFSVALAVLVVSSCTNAEPASKKASSSNKDTAAVSKTADKAGSTAPAVDSSTGGTADSKGRQLVVYYFCTTYRCPSCHYIEETTQSTLKEAFADELKSGRVVFKMLNVEEAGNEHYTQDYKLYTKSVVLSDLTDGKQTRWKNLDQVWQLIRNDKGFHDYIVKEVKSYLKA